MAIVTPTENDRYHMDGYLMANLDALKKNVKKNYDAFICVTGREGFGKSTLAFQMALYCDPTFNLDRCVFTSEQFIEAVENAEKYQAVVFDETMGYLGSRGAMSNFNRSLIKIMSEMRSKNLFIFLCIPNFFEMDRYPAIHRTTGLMYVYKRSCFASYDYPTKKKLYLYGKKTYSYAVPPNFRGKYVKYFPLNQEDYERKKQLAINSFTTETNTNKQFKYQRDLLVKYLLDKEILERKEVGDIIGIRCPSISYLEKE